MACYLQINTDLDPVPAYHADPDPAYHVDEDPDPTFQFDPALQHCHSSSHFFLVFLCLRVNVFDKGFFSFFQLDKTEDSELHVRKIQREKRQSTLLCSRPGDEVLFYLFKFMRFY